MAMPFELYNLLSNTDSLVAWYPYGEAEHTTGYTPNVADQINSGTLRLSLENFTGTDTLGRGVFRCIDTQLGYLRSGVESALQIAGDITIILRLTRVDTGSGVIMLTCDGDPTGESSSENIQYRVNRNLSTGEIYYHHEYSSGSSVLTYSGVTFPDDGQRHFIAVRRDTTAKEYSLSFDGSAWSSVAYATNPNGGSAAFLQNPVVSGTVAQVDAFYYDVMIFNDLIPDADIELIRTSGVSQPQWFDYSNWDGSAGTGYVRWRPQESDSEIYNMWLGPAGAEIGVSAYGRTFKQGILQGEREGRATDGTFRRDVQWRKNRYTLTYSMCDGDTMLLFENLLALKSELSFRWLDVPTGQEHTASVHMATLGGRRETIIGNGLWSGVTVELEEV